MPSSRRDKKISKYIPHSIQDALCYIDYNKFPVSCNKLSESQLLSILSVFIRSGKSFDEIKDELVEIADGKETELSPFVKSYPIRRKNAVAEELVMFFLGVFIAAGLLKIFINFQYNV